VFEDILRRHLRGKDWTLKHVMNITDIDDKIINKAIETGQDIKTYTAPYTEAFFKDCETLRIERPDIVTPATDYIPEMIDLGFSNLQASPNTDITCSRHRRHSKTRLPIKGCRPVCRLAMLER